MKKKSQDAADDDLRPEYDLGQLLRGAEQGRYAERFRQGTNLVLLEPDVAAVFPEETASCAVNVRPSTALGSWRR